MKKEKALSINKHVDDHNTTGIAQVSIRPVSSLLKRLIRWKNNEKTKLSNAATENRTCKPTSCIGITPSECSLPKNKAMGTPSRLSKTTKIIKRTTRVPEISHLRAGNHSKLNEEGENNVDQLIKYQ